MNIYVSNLSYNVSDSDLNELFGEYGTVSSAKVITDRYSGKSRGFGFVEMPESAEAQKAITELNQAEYDGRVINVNEAKERVEKPREQRSNNFGGGGRRNDDYNRR